MLNGKEIKNENVSFILYQINENPEEFLIVVQILSHVILVSYSGFLAAFSFLSTQILRHKVITAEVHYNNLEDDELARVPMD